MLSDLFRLCDEGGQQEPGLDRRALNQLGRVVAQAEREVAKGGVAGRSGDVPSDESGDEGGLYLDEFAFAELCDDGSCGDGARSPRLGFDLFALVFGSGPDLAVLRHAKAMLEQTEQSKRKIARLWNKQKLDQMLAPSPTSNPTSPSSAGSPESAAASVLGSPAFDREKEAAKELRRTLARANKSAVFSPQKKPRSALRKGPETRFVLGARYCPWSWRELFRPPAHFNVD